MPHSPSSNLTITNDTHLNKAQYPVPNARPMMSEKKIPMLCNTQRPIYQCTIKLPTVEYLATWNKRHDRIPAKKEPCLTPTLMDEGQARNPNTTYNGYKMEFWKFALTWKLICPVQHKITQKEQKETTKKGGISLTIMGQRQTYNSIHKPQWSPN